MQPALAYQHPEEDVERDAPAFKIVLRVVVTHDLLPFRMTSSTRWRLERDDATLFVGFQRKTTRFSLDNHEVAVLPLESECGNLRR